MQCRGKIGRRCRRSKNDCAGTADPGRLFIMMRNLSTKIVRFLAFGDASPGVYSPARRIQFRRLARRPRWKFHFPVGSDGDLHTVLADGVSTHRDSPTQRDLHLDSPGAVDFFHPTGYLSLRLYPATGLADRSQTRGRRRPARNWQRPAGLPVGVRTGRSVPHHPRRGYRPGTSTGLVGPNGWSVRTSAAAYGSKYYECFFRLLGNPRLRSDAGYPQGAIVGLCLVQPPRVGDRAVGIVEPRWKVLEVDGQSPMRKEFDPAAYPLAVPISFFGYPTCVDQAVTPIRPTGDQPRSIQTDHR